MPKVRIPTPLQAIAGNRAELDCPGATVGELIANLEKMCPGIKERLCDADGRIRRFLNLYVNDTDIRTLQECGTPLNATDEVSIIPAIAGGSAEEQARDEQVDQGPEHVVEHRHEGPAGRRGILFQAV